MVSKVLKWVTGGMEAFLGIPIIGASIIIGFLWTPLIVMLILHIVTLVFSLKEDSEIAPSILGIVTSCVGWIPFVGMTLHIITAILLMISASKKDPAQQS
ncbi:hypothetical protein [Fervidibacillus albus]|uniref:Uncharacterized protein n=1 Tax=Fervidibacillus albus TaxID=2980026 RepID=A0A9E8LUC5_9BACI|nr:hypothetical protein [Fervidibacillus albus]WAA09823.1 hypothetical protein OE104_00115 [Fervidibacillus albus]